LVTAESIAGPSQ